MIALKDVSVSYPAQRKGRQIVLNKVNLSINRGEMAYLIGPSGSGKSTILRLLYMDLLPEAGIVSVGPYRSDQTGKREIPYLRRALGIVFQDFQLLPDRTVYDNVAFALYATGQSNKKHIRSRTHHVLAHVGLNDKTQAYPHELSGGEQQRVCIARAIANEPHILLADEPTGNLDPVVADEIQRLLVDLHRMGMTVFMATHDYRIVRQFPARTVALVRGQLREVNPRNLLT